MHDLFYVYINLKRFVNDGIMKVQIDIRMDISSCYLGR